MEKALLFHREVAVSCAVCAVCFLFFARTFSLFIIMPGTRGEEIFLPRMGAIGTREPDG